MIYHNNTVLVRKNRNFYALNCNIILPTLCSWLPLSTHHNMSHPKFCELLFAKAGVQRAAALAGVRTLSPPSSQVQKVDFQKVLSPDTEA